MCRWSSTLRWLMSEYEAALGRATIGDANDRISGRASMVSARARATCSSGMMHKWQRRGLRRAIPRFGDGPPAHVCFAMPKRGALLTTGCRVAAECMRPVIRPMKTFALNASLINCIPHLLRALRLMHSSPGVTVSARDCMTAISDGVADSKNVADKEADEDSAEAREEGSESEERETFKTCEVDSHSSVGSRHSSFAAFELWLESFWEAAERGEFGQVLRCALAAYAGFAEGCRSVYGDSD